MGNEPSARTDRTRLSAPDAEAWLNGTSGATPSALDPLATIACAPDDARGGPLPATVRLEDSAGELPEAASPRSHQPTGWRGIERIDDDTMAALLGVGRLMALFALVFVLGMGAAFVVGRSSASAPPPPAARPAPAAPPPMAQPPASVAAEAAADMTKELPADASSSFHPEARVATEVATDLGPDEGVAGAPERIALADRNAPLPSQWMEPPAEPERPTIVVSTTSSDGSVVYTNVSDPGDGPPRAEVAGVGRRATVRSDDPPGEAPDVPHGDDTARGTTADEPR